MNRLKPVLQYIRTLWPLFCVIGVVIVAVRFTNYRPFNTLLSRQLLSWQIANVSNNHLDQGVAILQEAFALNPDNCEIYPILGNYYENQANTKGGSSNSPDLALLDKAIATNEESIERCPNSIPTLFAEDALAREYYYHGEIEQSIVVLKKLIDAKPTISYRDFDMGYLYMILGSEYEMLNNRTDAFNSFLQSAFYEANSGQASDSVKKLNQYLEEDPKLSAQLMPGKALGFGRYRSAAVTSDGIINLLAYARDNPEVLVYATSSNGNLWQTQDVLMVHDSIVGTVALDDKGVVHFVYSANGNTIVYANTRDGLDKPIVIDMTKTKTPLLNELPSSPVYVDTLQMVIDPRGNPDIICGYSNSQIGYVTIVNGVVSSPMIIANDAVDPDIAIEPNGAVAIAYNNSEAFPAPGTQVWFMEAVNNRWSSPIQISETGEWAGAASIETEPTGVTDVVYVTGDSENKLSLMYAFRDINGNWSRPEAIGSGQYQPWNPSTGTAALFGGRTSPSIAVVAGNQLAVVWRIPDTAVSTTVVGRMRDKLGVWGPIQVLGRIDGNDFHDTPSIVTSSGIMNRITLLWPETGEPVLHQWFP